MAAGLASSGCPLSVRNSAKAPAPGCSYVAGVNRGVRDNHAGISSQRPQHSVIFHYLNTIWPRQINYDEPEIMFILCVISKWQSTNQNVCLYFCLLINKMKSPIFWNCPDVFPDYEKCCDSRLLLNEVTPYSICSSLNTTVHCDAFRSAWVGAQMPGESGVSGTFPSEFLFCDGLRFIAVPYFSTLRCLSHTQHGQSDWFSTIPKDHRMKRRLDFINLTLKVPWRSIDFIRC